MRKVNGVELRAALSRVALAVLILVSVPATAQQADEKLVEIIVTARKTSESLQRVPIAITALTPEALAQDHIKNASEIHFLTPGLFAEQGQLDNSSVYFNIRGQQSASGFAESSVGVYVDGVYRQSQYGLNGALFDLERVEVLKGPQGTLYGKNTSGGVVHFISKKPDLESLGGYLTADSGAYATKEVQNFAGHAEGVVNVPIIDGKLALRVSGTYHRSDGYGTDGNGQSLNVRDDPFVRAQLLFKPGEAWQFLLSADYASFDTTGLLRVNAEVHPGPLAIATGVASGAIAPTDWPIPGVRPAGPTFASGLAKAIGLLRRDLDDGLFYHSNSTTGQLSNLKTGGESLTIDGELGEVAHLKSITAYRYLNNENLNDVAGTSVSQFVSSFLNDSTFWSQEVNLSGNLLRDKVDWLTGGFVSNNDDHHGGLPGVGIRALTALTGRSVLYDGVEVSRSVGVFGHGVFHATDSLSVTAGLRWSRDNRHVTPMDKTYNADGSVQIGCLPVTGAGGVVLTGATLSNGCVYPTLYHSDSGVSYEAAVNYQFTPSLMAYVTSRRGFRSGDFNTNGSYAPYNPEIATDYEIGVKSTFLEQKLLLNVAGYHTDYKDIQKSQTVVNVAGNAIGTAVQNAAKARIQGVEAEVRYRPLKGLELGGNYTYTDPKYTKWLEPTATPGVFIDHSDDEWEIPKHMFNISATYAVELASSDRLVLHGGLYYQSVLFFGQNLSLKPSETILRQKAYSLADARVSYEFTRADASVALFGRNLTDRKYYVGASALRPIGTSQLLPGEPRFVGIEFTKRFGR